MLLLSYLHGQGGWKAWLGGEYLTRVDPNWPTIILLPLWSLPAWTPLDSDVLKKTGGPADISFTPGLKLSPLLWA
jgi:hypothetical protein